jgi:Undecaprenyl-phosphate galactose phosphotransferase WbaP
MLRRELRALAIVSVDVTALVAAGLSAYAAWALPVRGQSLDLYLRLWPALPLFLLGYAQAGLYPGVGIGPVETLRRLSYVTLLTFMLLTGLGFALQVPYLYSRVTFLIALGAALVLVPVARLAFCAAVARTRWWPEPVVVVAEDASRARRVADELRQSRQIGYTPCGFLASSAVVTESTLDGLPVWREPETAVCASGATVALLSTVAVNSASMLDELHQTFQRVLVVRELDDLPVEGVRVHNLGGLIALEYTNNLLDWRNQAIKRSLDLVLGILALLISLPFLVAALLAVALRSRGPLFFHQEREGRSGCRILMPKVRTMVPGAEAALERALAANPELREEWSQRMKLREDPRLVPGVGKFLRRYSLDELPQLWSVLRGDLSLVGPRPFPDYHLDRFPHGFRELRRRVRPGITGLWQVTVRSEGSLDLQVSLDSYYIRNWSIWIDLYILARTVSAVLTGKGAF